MPNDTGRKISVIRLYGVTDTLMSSDLNIIEAVWDHFDGEWNERQPTSKEELWNVLQQSWRTVPGNYVKKIRQSLSKRVQLVRITKTRFLPFTPYFHSCADFSINHFVATAYSIHAVCDPDFIRIPSPYRTQFNPCSLFKIAKSPVVVISFCSCHQSTFLPCGPVITFLCLPAENCQPFALVHHTSLLSLDVCKLFKLFYDIVKQAAQFLVRFRHLEILWLGLEIQNARLNLRKDDFDLGSNRFLKIKILIWKQQ